MKLNMKSPFSTKPFCLRAHRASSRAMSALERLAKKNIVGNSSLQETSCEEKNRVGASFLMNTSSEEKKCVGTSFLMNTSCEEKIV